MRTKLCLLIGAMTLVCPACFGQSQQGYAHIGYTQITGPSSTPLYPSSTGPQPTSVRYLNYSHYSPWQFVPQSEHRSLDVPSPGYGKSDPGTNSGNNNNNNNTGAIANQAAASQADAMPSRNAMPVQAPHWGSGPQPLGQRQHYTHYSPGAFPRTTDDQQASNNNNNNNGTAANSAAAEAQVLKYTEEDAPVPGQSTQNPASTIGAYQSRLNY